MAVLLGLILVSTTRMRGRARAVECLSNLRHIGVAFQLYASDNSMRFPDPHVQHTSWESLIRPHLPSVNILRCPADEEVHPVINSSYDWRDGSDPRNSAAVNTVESCRAGAVLAFDALPGWHQRDMINVVRIDNSAQSMDAQECFADLRRMVTAPPVARH